MVLAPINLSEAAQDLAGGMLQRLNPLTA